MKYVVLFLVLNSVMVFSFGLKAKTQKEAELKNKESINMVLQSYNKITKPMKCEKFCKLERH